MKFIFWIEAALLSFAAVLLQITDLSKFKRFDVDDEYASRFRTNQHSFSEKVVYHFTKYLSCFLTNIVRYLFNALSLAQKMFVEDTIMNFDNLLVLADMFNNIHAVKENFWDMLFLFFKDEL